MYLILGMGISSLAVIRKLKELKKDFIVATNANEISNATCSVITYDNIKYLDLTKIEYVIKSPGIPFYNKYVRYLKSKHLKVINEIELTYILTKKVGKYIGISGSVGKSSVVSLLYNLIRSKNDNVILAGNIGVPLITYLDKINKDTIIILEISSFQLDDFDSMHLDIALLLNIYDNHLDVYKRKELYYKSKFNLTKNQNRNDYFIVNLDNYNTKKYLLRHCFKSKLIDYKLGFDIDNNYLYYYKHKILNLDLYKLKGEHNLDNLKAIITILNILNVKVDYKVIENFKELSYHIEEYDINNIKIVNDSKSTCVNSLKAAIETYKDKNLILLIGGYNKNLNFNILNNYKFKRILCFGSLSKEIDGMTYVDNKFVNLKDCVLYALGIAKNDDVILFSPGCASYDEFDNYIKRGEAFNKYVNFFFKNKKA